jgi:hypothetical protein
LAATICSSVTFPATLREKRLRRGSTPTIAPRSPAGRLRMATQSPTAGSSLRFAA